MNQQKRNFKLIRTRENTISTISTETPSRDLEKPSHNVFVWVKGILGRHPKEKKPVGIMQNS